MTIERRIAQSMVAAAVAACLLAVAGCGQDGTDGGAASTNPTAGVQVPAEQRGPGTNQAAGDPSKVAPLAAERRSELASGFPIEVPVPDGAVTRAEAQGDSAWVYEISVDAPPFDVAAWYRAAYASANWQLVRDQVASSGGTLIFVKGAGAQSKIRLTAEPGGTKVTTSVGVGEAVGETL